MKSSTGGWWPPFCTLARLTWTSSTICSYCRPIFLSPFVRLFVEEEPRIRVRYSRLLEESCFENRPLDYVYMLLIASFVLLVHFFFVIYTPHVPPGTDTNGAEKVRCALCSSLLPWLITYLCHGLRLGASKRQRETFFFGSNDLHCPLFTLGIVWFHHPCFG